MKQIATFTLASIGFLFFMICWHFAGVFLSAPDDMSVLIGYALYAIVIATALTTISFCFRKVLKMTKNLQMLLILTISAFALNGCTYVEPGYVGIVVNNYGSQKGVQDFPIKTGKFSYNPWTEKIYKFPTFKQNIVWTKDAHEGSVNDDSITFNSVEGAAINVDIAVSYSISAEKVPAIFVEFRQQPEQITNVYIRSKVRDAFSRTASVMKVTEIYGLKKQELQKNVTESLKQELEPKGFNIDSISIIGKMRVDPAVEKSINLTIEATNKAIEAENKIRQVEAEAKQAKAEAEGKGQGILALAEMQAQANDIVNKSLTPSLLKWKALERWDGILPKVTGETVPMISLDNLEEKN